MEGDKPAKPRGRRPRESPNTGAGPDWLAEPFDNAIQETARRFALNLKAAIGERYTGLSGRNVADEIGVDHNSLRRILAGDSYPDLVFIVKAETATNKRLWPGRVR